jgi:uncharacterized integral membrane protein
VAAGSPQRRRIGLIGLAQPVPSFEGKASTEHIGPNKRTMGLSRNRRHPTVEVPATPAHFQRDVMSSNLHRPQHVPADPTTAPLPVVSPAATTANRVPHTRTGAAWFGVCAAASLFVVLIVFMLQNTRDVEITFLWMHGSLPLALALLIAAVGATILAATVGAARITQLRRLARRH